VLADIDAAANLDVGLLFDEYGRLKPIHTLPLPVRRPIVSVEPQPRRRLAHSLRSRPTAKSSLEPDLNLVTIRIGDVRVGKTWSELTATEKTPSGALDLTDGLVDVVRVHEPKAEMRDAANRAGGAGVLGERENVVPPRGLRVDEALPAPVLMETEDLLVESQRALRVLDR
jgi:hypothetical protein